MSCWADKCKDNCRHEKIYLECTQTWHRRDHAIERAKDLAPSGEAFTDEELVMIYIDCREWICAYDNHDIPAPVTYEGNRERIINHIYGLRAQALADTLRAEVSSTVEGKKRARL